MLLFVSGESLSINVFMSQDWDNPTTTWDPNDYGGITKINVRPEKTWVPDIYAYGDVEGDIL